VQTRWDYAIFAGDRFSHNSMLTREEAEAHEREGMRCVDVEAANDPTLPRFRDRITVASRSRNSRRWDR
jgi:hypothetical protein